MLKYIALNTLFALSVLAFVFGVIATKKSSAKIQFPLTPRSTVEIESITLDKKEVFIGCPPIENNPFESEICWIDDLNVKVSTKLRGELPKGWKIYYIVSVGEILGEGTDIIWRLTRPNTGKQNITAAVGKESVVYGKPMTKEVEVSVCNCPEERIRCNCPSLKIITPPKSVKAGQTIILEAKAYGEDFYTFQWETSAGTILAGQRTNKVLLKTDPKMKEDVLNITVLLGGTNGGCGCETEFVKTVKVKKS